jgi:hypothetical protein
MSEEGRKWNKKDKPTYIMVPRKLVTAWVVSFITMLVMVCATIQWAYYIDKRSNQRWCGLVKLFNEEYKKEPPTNDLGKNIAREMLKIQNSFGCK